MGDMICPKNGFRMCVTTVKKEDDKLITVKEKWVYPRAKKFREDLYNSDHTIELVNKRPDQIKINQFYMLLTRDVVWVWIEEEGE